MTLDSMDKAILNALRWDAKTPMQSIAKKLHIPLSTVHHRIKRFEVQKIISRYETMVNYAQIGRPIQAFIMVGAMNVLPSGKRVYQQEILDELIKFEAVEEAYIITGTADLMVRVQVKDIDELNSLITVKLRKLDGVGSTQTMMVLKESGHQPNI